MTIIQIQHLAIAALTEIEQRQVPPVVRYHERVQIGPGIRHFLHELRTLVDATAGQQHVRERMLRPRLLAPQGERRTRLGFRLVEQLALFISEGRHAVHIRHFRVCRYDFQRNPQHLRRAPAIELQILMHLDDR